MRDRLFEIFDDVRDNPDLWVAVLTGEGGVDSPDYDLLEMAEKAAWTTKDRALPNHRRKLEAHDSRHRRVLSCAGQQPGAILRHPDRFRTDGLRLASSQAWHRLDQRPMFVGASHPVEHRL
jgi:hypothetical protein